LEIKEGESKEKLTLVWLGEYYHRTKKLPDLQKELKRISGNKREPMTTDQMLAVVKRLNQQFGGSVKKGGE
jgi:hypothetical protein